jgi:hypothetical protein
VLSAFIKNIGALAIMIPVAFQFARRSNTSPSVYLMPMAFRFLLGGLMTQIGTSPNIVVSRVRQEITGTRFTMFDFTPSVLRSRSRRHFLIFFHWLVPSRTREPRPRSKKRSTSTTMSPRRGWSSDSTVVGKTLSDLLKLGDGRRVGHRHPARRARMSPFPRYQREGDTVLLEGSPDGARPHRLQRQAETFRQAAIPIPAEQRHLISIEAITSESQLVGWLRAATGALQPPQRQSVGRQPKR